MLRKNQQHAQDRNDKKGIITKARIVKYAKRTLLLSVLSFILCWWVTPCFTPVTSLVRATPLSSTIILDRNGETLHHLTRKDHTRHRHITYEQLPETLIKATLAAEDKRYFSHSGIDILATSRSLKDAIKHRKFISGASTITQQTIKLIYPKTKRTLSTKIIEAFRARSLEITHTKETILETYFNHLEYGNRTQGPIQAAAHYFNKPLDQLSLAEYALLAGIPQAPTRHNPRNNPESALKRRNWVLDRMAIVYQIPTEDIDRAKREPIQLAPPAPHDNTPQIAELLSEESTPSIQTTISKNLQTAITSITQRELQKIQHHNVNNAAVVVIHNPTGEILTLLGSPNFDTSIGGKYNGALIPRSPGSALKPFTYLLSFQHRGFTPATIIPDIPTSYPGSRGAEKVVNYDRKYHGPVTISHALGNSLNIPAVRVLNLSGGSEKLLTLLEKFGITTLENTASIYGLSLSIGGGEVTLLEITNAYATLARNGIHLPITLKKQSTQHQSNNDTLSLPQTNHTRNNDTLSLPQTNHTRNNDTLSLPQTAHTRNNNTPSLNSPSTHTSSRTVADPHQCYLIAQILSNNSARSDSFGTHSHLRLPFPCAVKTGTSTDYKDNFCVGYTKDFTVGVWVGNINHTSMKGISGVTGAGPIFQQIMLALHKTQTPTWFEKPAAIHTYNIDPHTGKELSPSHPRYPLAEKLSLLHPPTKASESDYDSQMKPYLDQRFDPWLETATDKFAKKRHIKNTAPLEHFHILSPADNATYLLDPDIPNNGKHLTLTTNTPNAHWTSQTLTIHQNTVTLTPGKHTLTAQNPTTQQTKTVTITVKEL